ncbi:MAG: L-rhamnose/proton symporter RhaT [Terriglobia bacterium]
MLNWAGVVLAGLLNGSFAVPLKTTRTWKFNHIWMVHSLLAMCVLPWIFAIAVVPDWSGILRAVPAYGWLGLMGWGVLFGIGSLLYGVAVDLLGIALGFAIQLGLSIVLGALLPLIWAGVFSLRTRDEWIFLAGLAVMVAGVILCAQAGGAKSATAGASGGRFRKGIIIAIVGGILAPTLNFGIQYGTSLLASTGDGSASAQFPVRTYLAWAVFLSAAALIQAGTCLVRILRAHQAGVFGAPGAVRDVLQVLVMSTVWIASVFVYGRSAFGLGRLGISVGWPIFVGLIILASNAWGVVLGEWQGAPRATFRRMLAGSAVLVVAAFLIGQGNPAK